MQNNNENIQTEFLFEYTSNKVKKKKNRYQAIKQKEQSKLKIQ